MEIVAILGIMTSWLIYFLTTKSGADENYLRDCRNDILQIQVVFEELFKEVKSLDSSHNSYILFIKNIKKILLLFKMHQAGLLVKNKKIESKIQKCLQEIRRYEYDYENEKPRPHEVAVYLLMEWGIKIANRYDDSTLRELERFYYAGFLKRLRIRFIEILTVNKLKVIITIVFYIM